jgi:hypothetical protein
MVGFYNYVNEYLVSLRGRKPFHLLRIIIISITQLHGAVKLCSDAHLTVTDLRYFEIGRE